MSQKKPDLNINQFVEKAIEGRNLNPAEYMRVKAQLLIGGCKASDTKGHAETVQFKVEPAVRALLGRVKEAYPPHHFRTPSDVARATLLLGLYDTFLMSGMDAEELEKMEKILKELAYINGEYFFKEVTDRFHQTKKNIQLSSMPNKDDIVKAISNGQAAFEELIMKHMGGP